MLAETEAQTPEVAGKSCIACAYFALLSCLEKENVKSSIGCRVRLPCSPNGALLCQHFITGITVGRMHWTAKSDSATIATTIAIISAVVSQSATYSSATSLQALTGTVKWTANNWYYYSRHEPICNKSTQLLCKHLLAQLNEMRTQASAEFVNCFNAATAVGASIAPLRLRMDTRLK